ncbi:hypothetical protein [Variovorax arabinosiphilus]|uniref:hypothetical protein n=1 Tax=Variovorax arabinosiphilus TaxID=3053498 RepID=UPI002575F80C|nr:MULTISPECIES: hypothetical protein [unclassified Variovorax]MDM0121640.1 hypothetical protein [Variovorax sp. J2L1-78]MDM0130701.1 hypothetical protein [Variovorax sp. J2L1-63]
MTEQYSEGMEALRRHEPGASARMMEIARQLRQYALLVGEAPLPPISAESQKTRQVSVASTLGRLAMAMPTLPRIRARRMLSMAVLPS